MKIAFLFNRQRTYRGDGIISQIYTWKRLLEERGHIVDLITQWKYYDFSDYDIIQYFSIQTNTFDDINDMYKRNKNIVIAPILDPRQGIMTSKVLSFIGKSFRPVLVSQYYCLRAIREKVKLCLVRSDFEKKYLCDAYGYKSDEVRIVRLSNGVTPLTNKRGVREGFCLHISRLGDDGKNVKNLIEASEKYKFKLILCGMLKEDEEPKFKSWIEGKHYVEYLGYATDEMKRDLCSRAKVFALPSKIEGVGLSALEAATWGCDIVITNAGGPKEYYADMAKVVDPNNIDDIGRSIKYFLDGGSFQPALSKYIVEHFSDEKIGMELENAYTSILNKK